MVVILLGAGFEEAEALVPLDLLRRAGVEVRTAGIDSLSVTGSHQITVQADCIVREIDPEQVEMLILPGGLGGVASIQASSAALDLIRRMAERGTRLAAICAAPTILAKLGLLEGKKAVCYPDMEDEMAGCELQSGTPVVTDGNITTAEAAGSAFAFGLRLVELLRGEATAQSVKNAVYYRG